MTASRTQLTLNSADGTQLAAQRWSPVGEVKAALLIIHGYADHAERYREFALAIADKGIDVTAIDLRGHGRSRGQRGYIGSFDQYHADVESAFASMAANVKGVSRFVLGHSNGGLVALDWVASKAPHIQGLVVTNPFLSLAMKVNPFKISLAHVFARTVPRLALPSGIDPVGLTHDTAIVDAYARDPYVFKTATAGWFRASRAAQARVRAVTQIDVPLLYVHSDADPIASPTINAETAARISSPDKTVLVRHGELHEVLNELARAELFTTVGEWILTRA